MKIPFKSKLQSIKKIAKRNDAFWALEPIERRREIAYDQLLLSIKGVTNPANGFYWDDELYCLYDGTTSAQELQEAMIGVESCEVCQRGGLMLSRIRLGNKLEPNTFTIELGDDNTSEFPNESLFAMEKEYEYSHYSHPYDTKTHNKYMNIACNVIANGDFKIDDMTDYVTLWEINS